jgi:hypothetical protein
MPVGPGISLGCANDDCVIDAARILSATRVNCTSLPPIDFAGWSCTGRWAFEGVSDGFAWLCTIEPIATGAERWSVSCGECVTIVEMMN